MRNNTKWAQKHLKLPFYKVLLDITPMLKLSNSVKYRDFLAVHNGMLEDVLLPENLRAHLQLSV
jgi:hypothetical protein